jgi:ABC-type molybdate transport system substrate-binding protein
MRQLMRARLLLLALSLIAAAVNLPARADYPVAPDVVVFCQPTLRRLVTDLGAKWTAETGVPVRVFAAPNWANLAQLVHPSRDDVLFGEGDIAAAKDLIRNDTVLKLWQNKLVAAALTDDAEKARAASPPMPLNLASVAGKAPIAIVDPPVAEAGKETEAALQTLGLWNPVKSNSIGVVGTADAAFLLSQRKVKLAIIYASDASANRDFTVTDTLPVSGQPTVYWAALTARAPSPNAAKFLAFLGKPEVREQGKTDGLEVLP